MDERGPQMDIHGRHHRVQGDPPIGETKCIAGSLGCNGFSTRPVSLEWSDSKIIEWGELYQDICRQLAIPREVRISGQTA